MVSQAMAQSITPGTDVGIPLAGDPGTPPPPTVDPPPTSPTDFRPLPPERPAPGTIVRPVLDRPALPAEVAALIAEFEKQRDAYLQAQRDLLKQLKGATDEERARIREQLKAQREAWLEQTKAIREDIRKKMEELRDKLPNRKDIKDNLTPRPGNRPGVN